MTKQTFLLLIIIFLSCCAPSRIPRDSSYLLPSKRTGIYYSIKQGDSLWKISKQYNVSVEKIMRQNNISSPYGLRVGQKIFIPRYFSPKSTSFIWPLKGEVINYFNEYVDNTLNRGVNIQASFGNRETKAVAQGHVVFASSLKGWGKTVILKHDSNLYTIYANLDNTTIKEGASAKKGEVLGMVAAGKTGSYILHFEVRKKHTPEDPLKYLN